VNRLGNPVFNEVLVALRDKDRYNFISPEKDEDYHKYAENPEVTFLINAVLFADPEGDGPLATTGPTDLAASLNPNFPPVRAKEAAEMMAAPPSARPMTPQALGLRRWFAALRMKGEAIRSGGTRRPRKVASTDPRRPLLPTLKKLRIIAAVEKRPRRGT